MRNKRAQVIMIITIVLLLLYPISSWANTLTLKTITDKENYMIGEKVIITIGWTEKMQSASFTLKYDAEKLQFESSDIANIFYNQETAGEIKVNWASMEENDYTKMVFHFKAIGEGAVQITLDNPNSFADGNLVSPDDYNTNSATKTIHIKTNSENKDTSNTTDLNKGNNTIKKDNTTANGKIPQTGKEIIILCFIVGLLIFGTVGLIKYRKVSDI